MLKVGLQGFKRSFVHSLANVQDSDLSRDLGHNSVWSAVWSAMESWWTLLGTWHNSTTHLGMNQAVHSHSHLPSNAFAIYNVPHLLDVRCTVHVSSQYQGCSPKPMYLRTVGIKRPYQRLDSCTPIGRSGNTTTLKRLSTVSAVGVEPTRSC